jgi:hypothetical protein
MSTEVPYAADAEISLTYDELEVSVVGVNAGMLLTHRHTLFAFGGTRNPCPPPLVTSSQVLKRQYEKELESPYVSVQTKFNLAWGLVKSPRHEDQVEGVKLLQGTYPHLVAPLVPGTTLTIVQNPVEIYRAEPTRRRECLYYLALGHYKMGNYDDAKKFNCAFSFLRIRGSILC